MKLYTAVIWAKDLASDTIRNAIINFLAKDEDHAAKLTEGHSLERYPSEEFGGHGYRVGTPLPDEIFKNDERYLEIVDKLEIVRDWYYLGFPDAGRDDLEKALGINS